VPTHTRTPLLRFPAVFFLVVLFARAAAADPPTLSGTVTDPSGSAIAGAAVVLRALDSGRWQTATTNNEGYYAFVAPEGRYELEISSPYFETFHQTELVLVAANPTRMDVKLCLESRAESITVVEEAMIPDPSSTQLGQDLAEKRISSVPLKGRNFADLRW